MQRRNELISWPSTSNKNSGEPTPCSINFPPAKFGAVRSLLEVLLDNDEPVSDEDRRRFHERQAFFASGKGIPMDDVLAEFGMKPEDFPLSTPQK